MKWLLALVALAGCTTPGSFPAHDFPATEDPQPGSVRFSLRPSGEVLRDGTAVSLETLPEVAVSARLVKDPKCIERPEGARLGIAGPLLRALIEKGSCVNVAFVIRTSGVEREIPLTVELDHLCRCLYYFEGSLTVDEHLSGCPEHVWIEARACPLRVTRISSDIPGSIWFPPDVDSPVPPASPPDPWAAEPLPEGPLTPESVRDFLSRKRIRESSPVVSLELRAEDDAQAALSALSTLRAGGAQVIVSLVGF